jgi:hypothetical protein
MFKTVYFFCNKPVYYVRANFHENPSIVPTVTGNKDMLTLSIISLYVLIWIEHMEKSHRESRFTQRNDNMARVALSINFFIKLTFNLATCSIRLSHLVLPSFYVVS